MVNVIVPSPTVPAVLATVAERPSDRPEVLNTADAADAVTVVAACAIVRLWLLSADVMKFAVPL
jgi:hypothetical protein